MSKQHDVRGTATPAPSAPLRFRIRTPDANFGGIRAGVHISGGVGYTSDPKAAEYCHSLGYAVTDDTTGQPAFPPAE
jgi:hypothetical protein